MEDTKSSKERKINMRNTWKRMMALVIAGLLAIGMLNALAFAAVGEPITETTGTITVENAAKGETYKLYKIFGATISKVEGANGVADAVAYTFSGDLPSTLSGVFEKIGDTDYVQRKKSATDDAIIAAVKAYAATLAEPTDDNVKTGTGVPVVFSGLEFGYYYVTSSQGANVTIDSANPNAVIYDKNSKTPSPEKTVEHESYSIGDTVKYTATFSTPNFLGSGADAKQVTKIKVEDTLPEYLSNVTVTSAKIYAADGTTVEGDVTSLFANFGTTKTVFVPWATWTPGEEYADAGGKTGDHSK
ncbi:MAG: isopeptide-forming domain-containing fimbrial protein, partial [Verrucomicrobia bacterium]|nr:isopeptide-forming domain-containing fimbrial protein [Verrucomicrobiota bacterium]